MNFRLGSVVVQHDTRLPFHPYLRTVHFVEAHPLEGPVNVRAVVFWLWFVVSYNAGKRYLAQARKFWDENEEVRAQSKAAYEKHMAETGQSDEQIP